jgi:two-component system sensor histidine kinase/response regulator
MLIVNKKNKLHKGFVIKEQVEMEKKDILIVDDDRVTLGTLEKILLEAGYSVIPISLGREAVKTAKDRSPDLIILDIMMPDMDGGDVAHILKNDPETRDIPIIFLSSLVTKKEKQNSSRKHGLCFLAKPINRDELLKWVREYIRKTDHYLVED